MAPEFSRVVADTLAKRAALMCSNVECRTVTAGPAGATDKAISIGEAAHIFGARQGAARYRDDMTDVSRAELTNGIWLCRNCHKLIDSDASRHPPDLLFRWRTLHEEYVLSKLGTPNDRLRSDLNERQLDQFRNDSALIRQIVRDRPNGWEYRSTGEFLRDYLKPTMRGWRDLRQGLYTKPPIILTDDNALAWLRTKIDELGRLVPILASLFTEELPRAWGNPGEPGDPLEIRHICKLIQSAAEQLLHWEEDVRAVSVGDTYSALSECLPGAAGMQLEQLGGIPSSLDEVADWIETSPGVPKEFHYTIVFSSPDGWPERIAKELKMIEKGGTWF
jgi:hypothetical protein